MDFRLLGPVQALDDAGRAVSLRPGVRVLLALLLLNANREVDAEFVVSTLGKTGPEIGTVRRSLTDLRRTFSDTVVSSKRGTVLFNLDKLYCVDYYRFLAGLDAARAANSPDAVADAARQALGEWHGEALEGLDRVTWASGWVSWRRPDLEQQRAEAWRLLLEAELSLGRHLRVLSEIGEPLAASPWDETLVGFRMLALYRAERAADALTEYHEFRGRLAEGLGVDPGPSLRKLHQGILRNDSALDLPIVAGALPPRCPDRARSRVLLIGASAFPGASGFPPIPAIRNNINRLVQLLTAPLTGVIPAENCTSVVDPTSLAEVGRLLGEATTEAEDMLLVYYAGHGLLDRDGKLFLALSDTMSDRLGYTALSLDLLRRDLLESPAKCRILILDCCFSGRAIEALSDSDSLVSGQIEVSGTYTLTSAAANDPAYAPRGQKFTAFTGSFMRALEVTPPLSLDQIYLYVTRDLASQGLPPPQRRAVRHAGALSLARRAHSAER